MLFQKIKINNFRIKQNSRFQRVLKKSQSFLQNKKYKAFINNRSNKCAFQKIKFF